MLLSDSAEKEFKKDKYEFFRTEKHTLSLEFSIKGKFYTITRQFEDEENISFGESDNAFVEYNRSELLDVLLGLFFPVEGNDIYVEGNKFRSLMQFFIKDDIQTKGRKEATNFFSFTPSASERAGYNFYLLGIPNRNVHMFSEVSKEYKKYSDALKTHEEKLKIESGHSVEEYRSEKLRIEASIATLRERLKSYDFKDTHKELEKDLSDVVKKINEKSQEYHAFSQKLKNLRDAYQLNQDIDTRQIQKIYNEVLSNFGNAVKKTLDEVKNFKYEILENRNKFLVAKEHELQIAIDSVFRELSVLEADRTKLLKTLSERGALDKLESTYEDLITEQSAYEKQNQILTQVDEYNRILSDQEIVISQIRKDISDDVLKAQKSLDELRQLFIDILSSAIFLDEGDVSGYFDISLARSNRKDALPFKFEVNIPKSSSVGQEGLKILAYDLMIFLHAIKHERQLPDFLIHDGVFHGISHKVMVNILNYVYRKHLELYQIKNFQYIVTFSEDEIIIPIEKKNVYGDFAFPFDDKKVIELEDVAYKMLFKRDIK